MTHYHNHSLPGVDHEDRSGYQALNLMLDLRHESGTWTIHPSEGIEFDPIPFDGAMCWSVLPWVAAGFGVDGFSVAMIVQVFVDEDYQDTGEIEVLSALLIDENRDISIPADDSLLIGLIGEPAIDLAIRERCCDVAFAGRS